MYEDVDAYIRLSTENGCFPSSFTFIYFVVDVCKLNESKCVFVAGHCFGQVSS